MNATQRTPVSSRRAANRRETRIYEVTRWDYHWNVLVFHGDTGLRRYLDVTEATYNRFARIANAIIARRFEGIVIFGVQGNDSFVWSIDRTPQ